MFRYKKKLIGQLQKTQKGKEIVEKKLVSQLYNFYKGKEIIESGESRIEKDKIYEFNYIIILSD